MTDIPIVGVIGDPISHSKSPLIHNRWLKQNSIKGLYLRFEVKGKDLQQFIKDSLELGFRGFNVTIPHKETVVSIVDDLSAAARDCGAINTIVRREDGSFFGDNTDGFGFIENLSELISRDDLVGASVALLGAGGASRAVAVALRDAGVRQIRICNRTTLKAEALCTVLGDVASVWPWPATEEFFAGADLIVNSTSLGMAGQPAFDLPIPRLEPNTVATDLIYAPLETPFLNAARASGARTKDGLGMLLHQARPGFKAWFGIDPVVSAELRQAVLTGEGLYP
ncbi:MAG: shikimate dehydrogenase [Pseudomonadota bacterium]